MVPHNWEAHRYDVQVPYSAGLLVVRKDLKLSKHMCNYVPYSPSSKRFKTFGKHRIQVKLLYSAGQIVV